MIIPINSLEKEQIIDITSDIQQIVSSLGVKAGICIIQTQHTTSGITINENADPDVKSDILKGLEIFDRDDYRHSEGNSSAHIKSSLMGASVNIIVENGTLQLGTWQGIMFCEFDGPRNRKVLVEVISKREI